MPFVWSLYAEKGSDFCNHEVKRGPIAHA